MIWLFPVLIVLLLLSFSGQAKAVPPPDFIFNITSQIVPVFSFLFALLLTFLSAVYRFFRYSLAQYKWIFWLLGVCLVGGIAWGGSYFYDQYAQQQAYQIWLKGSKQNKQTALVPTPFINVQPEISQTPVLLSPSPQFTTLTATPSALAIMPTSPSSTITALSSLVVLPADKVPTMKDLGQEFIENYYDAIAHHQFSQAYAMSKKSVSLATFTSWYSNTTAVSFQDIVNIDEQKYSLHLTLTEEGKSTAYAVLMTLALDGLGRPVQVADSQVRVIDDVPAPDVNVVVAPTVSAHPTETPLTNFFTSNQSLDLKITNADFDHIRHSQLQNFIVVDARENIEFDNGNLPGSIHIRFADLRAGRWIELPQDKFIYVLCWSGIRGKEVAEFLRSKQLVARYLEKGADGWVSFGGEWQGNIKFSETYTDDKYKLVLSTDEVKRKIQEGITIVDARPPTKFAQSHIPQSINIPLMYTPSSKFEEVFSQIQSNQKVVTVCDDYVNCFDAKLVGIELERRGATFLGRYNSPWEF